MGHREKGTDKKLNNCEYDTRRKTTAMERPLCKVAVQSSVQMCKRLGRQ